MKHTEMSRWKQATVIGVLALALVIVVIDGTLLNVSFSYIVHDLNTNVQSLQWVITAYALTIAALTVTGGRLGDLYGRKKMFILGAILFGIGSLIASYSKTTLEMIIGESIIEGIGAAMMLPATASLIVSTFTGRARATAMGVYGGMAGAGAAIGPVLGGYLTTHYSWRYGFRINVFVVILLLIGSIVIKEYRDEEHKPTLDYTGIILSSLSMFALVFGIIESSTYGWIKAKEIFQIGGHNIDLGNMSIVVPSLVISIILMVVFILWENRREARKLMPLVSMRLFKNRQFITGVVTLSIVVLGQAGVIFASPIFFQVVLGLDAFKTGLVFLPSAISALIFAPVAAAVSRKVKAKYIIQVGILANIVAMTMMYFILKPNAVGSDFYLAFFIYGMGIGLVMSPVSNLILSAVPVKEAGEASGVNNTFRQIGSTMGSAVIGAVLLATLTTNVSNLVKKNAVLPEQSKPGIEKMIQVAVSGARAETGTPSQGISPVMAKEIKNIANQGITDAAKHALLYAIGFIGLAFIISFLMPSRKEIETGD